MNHHLWCWFLYIVLKLPTLLVVGGIPTPSEKYEFVSWDDEIPIYYGQITFMFQTTNQLLDGHSLLNLPTTVEVSTEPTNLKSCPNKSTSWPWQIQGWTWPCIFRHGLVWGIMTWLCMSMWHKLKSNSTYNYIPRSLTRKCAPKSLTGSQSSQGFGNPWQLPRDLLELMLIYPNGISCYKES